MLYKSFHYLPLFSGIALPLPVGPKLMVSIFLKQKGGMGYGETLASWGINTKSAMFRVGAAASLVLSTLGFIFKCVITQSAAMPFLFFGSRSISFLLAPQLILLDLQGHKHVVTAD